MLYNWPGPEAAKEMRALGYTGPIIGITGNGVQADIDKFIQYGANKVLLKPVVYEKLEQILLGIWYMLSKSQKMI